MDWCSVYLTPQGLLKYIYLSPPLIFPTTYNGIRTKNRPVWITLGAAPIRWTGLIHNPRWEQKRTEGYVIVSTSEHVWRNDKWQNKRVLIWHFTLVLIKINYGQIGDQTSLFYTTNPVISTSGNWFVHRTGTFENLIFHLSRRTTIIQDLLVWRQFSLVSDKR
jgi:hypothetical protein